MSNETLDIPDFGMDEILEKETPSRDAIRKISINRLLFIIKNPHSKDSDAINAIKIICTITGAISENKETESITVSDDELKRIIES